MYSLSRIDILVHVDDFLKGISYHILGFLSFRINLWEMKSKVKEQMNMEWFLAYKISNFKYIFVNKLE